MKRIPVGWAFSQQVSVKAGDCKLIIWKPQLIGKHLQKAPLFNEAAFDQHLTDCLLYSRFVLQTDRRFQIAAGEDPEFNEERAYLEIDLAFRQGILELLRG